MGPPVVDGWGLGLAASLLCINAGLSLWLRLGLERALGVAALRAAVQLSLLAMVLEPVFSIAHPAAVVGLVLVMVLLAGREAARRTSRSYAGMGWVTLVAMGGGAGLTAVIGTGWILRADPWWEPRYLIPFVGMILGNTLTGVSLGLDTVLRALDEQRSTVELRMALGASPWEACRPLVADATRTGMLPIVNAMSVAGLVTIPGMMTGQLLGGSSPSVAARYQVLILFLITAAVGVGVGVAVITTLRLLFDARWRLRLERLTHR